jgi:hypothetical protein
MWGLVVGLSLLAMSACSAGGDADSDSDVAVFPGQGQGTALEEVTLGDLSGFNSADSTDNTDGGVCACTTYECVQQWIGDNIGCDVCVGFQCDGQSVHGCATCDDPLAGQTAYPSSGRVSASR